MWNRDRAVIICRSLFPILTSSWAAVSLADRSSEAGGVEQSGRWMNRVLRITVYSLLGGLIGYVVGYLGPQILEPGGNQNTLFAIFIMFPLGLIGGAGFGIIRELKSLGGGDR